MEFKIRMFYIYYCNKIHNNVYDIKINKKDKNKLIQNYSLQEKGNCKEYWENNVCIILSNDSYSFNYIEDVRYETVKLNKNNFLIHEFKEKPCQPYNFYKVHQEEKYKNYQAEKGNLITELREYQDYLTLTFRCDNIDDFYQQTIF